MRRLDDAGGISEPVLLPVVRPARRHRRRPRHRLRVRRHRPFTLTNHHHHHLNRRLVPRNPILCSFWRNFLSSRRRTRPRSRRVLHRFPRRRQSPRILSSLKYTSIHVIVIVIAVPRRASDSIAGEQRRYAGVSHPTIWTTATLQILRNPSAVDPIDHFAVHEPSMDVKPKPNERTSASHRVRAGACTDARQTKTREGRRIERRDDRSIGR